MKKILLFFIVFNLSNLALAADIDDKNFYFLPVRTALILNTDIEILARSEEMQILNLKDDDFECNLEYKPSGQNRILTENMILKMTEITLKFKKRSHGVSNEKHYLMKLKTPNNSNLSLLCYNYENPITVEKFKKNISKYFSLELPEPIEY